MINKKSGLLEGTKTLSVTYVNGLNREELILLIFRLKEENLILKGKLNHIHELSYEVRGYGLKELKQTSEEKQNDTLKIKTWI